MNRRRREGWATDKRIFILASVLLLILCAGLATAASDFNTTGFIYAGGNLYTAENLYVAGAMNVTGAGVTAFDENITVNGGIVCTAENGLCNNTQSVDYQSSAAGWTNTSTTTSTSLDVNVTTGNLTVPNGRLGVGTSSPSYGIDVRGTTANDAINSQVGLNIDPVDKPTSGTATLINTAGNVDEGAHTYLVTYTTALGETGSYQIGSVTTNSSYGQVNVTIPVSSDSRVTGRKIYRTKSGTPGYTDYLLTTISDNVATSYTDNTADADLTGTSGGGYYHVDTTSNYIQVGGQKVMVADPFQTSFGIGSLSSVDGGGSNTAFGYYAGAFLTSGKTNTFLGASAGYHITTGSNNVLVGPTGGSISTGGSNVFVGRNNGLTMNGSSGSNTAVGYYALAGVGGALSARSGNVAIGSNAGHSSTGDYNTYVGTSAAHDNTNSSNVMIGYKAGYYTSGSNLLVIANSDTTTPLIEGLFTGTGAGLTINSQATDGTPLIVKGISSQSSNLQQWQNSSGTALASVNASGTIFDASGQVCTAENGLCNQSSSDTVWSLTGDYLYNNSGSLDFNETKLNATIDARGTANGYLTSVPYQSSAAGWTNTSTTTSTSLDVNVTTGNLTVPNGNVGIGTNTPTNTVDISDTNTNLKLTSTTGNYYPGIELVDSSGTTKTAAIVTADSTSDLWWLGQDLNAANSSDFYLWNEVSDYTAWYVNASNYYVQIGGGAAATLPQPQARLHVRGTSDEKQFIVQGTSGQTANLTEWQDSSGSTLSYVNASGTIFDASGQVCTASNGLCNQTASTDTVWSLTGDYLYNNSGSLDFNETKLNATIDARGTANGYLTSVPYQSSAAGWTNDSTTTSTSLDVNITSRATDAVPLTVHGIASQSANLTEWQNSSGDVLTSVDASGDISLPTQGSVYMGSGALQSGISGQSNGRLNLMAGGATSAQIWTTGIILSPNTGYPLIQKTVATATNPGYSFYYDLNTGLGYSGEDNLSLITGGVEAVRIDDGQNVGIGTASPDSVLDVDIGTSTDTGLIVQGAASQSANLQEWQDSGGTANAYVDANGTVSSEKGFFQHGAGNAYDSNIGTYLGFYAKSSGGAGVKMLSGVKNSTYNNFKSLYISGGASHSSGALGTIYGTYNDVANGATGTGTTTNQIANYAIHRQNSANALTSSTGFQSYAYATGAGTVSSMKGLYSNAYISSASNVGNVRHVEIANANNQGTLSTQYGLYIANLDAANNNYAIYSAGGQSILNAGTATYVPLTIKGAASQTANLQEWQNSGGSLLASVGSDGMINVTPTNSTGSTDLLVNPTVKTSGNLIAAQVGGANKFTVTSAGVVTATTYFSAPRFVATTNNQMLVGNNAWSTATPSTGGLNFAGSTYSNTAGDIVAVGVTPTYNQASGTSSNTDFLIDRTETAVGSGTQLLLDAQVDGTSKFNISTTGNVNAAGNITLPTTSSCLILPGGGKLCGNSTCSLLYSPDGNTVLEACN